MTRPGPEPAVYLWRGENYRGMRAVARAAGVTCSTVAHHLNRHGNLDRLGCGAVCNWKPGAHTRPISMGSLNWPSVTAFAAALGVHRCTATAWLRAGDCDRILSRLMAADVRTARAAKAGAA